MTKKYYKEEVKEQIISLVSLVSEIQEFGKITRKNIAFEAQKEINKIEGNAHIEKAKMEENLKCQLDKLEKIEKLIKDKGTNT
ncbi:hypothetical protein [Clostridium sp.]|uniref:hypothetical protein n=1 Tax=Clostridium sp. TaxID=1506 RepID=UPI003D6CD999